MSQSVKPWHFAVALALMALLLVSLWRNHSTPRPMSVTGTEVPRGAAPLDEVAP